MRHLECLHSESEGVADEKDDDDEHEDDHGLLVAAAKETPATDQVRRDRRAAETRNGSLNNEFEGLLFY